MADYQYAIGTAAGSLQNLEDDLEIPPPHPAPYREWASTYDAGDGRNNIKNTGDRVVRGGSWYDRPKRCRSGFRLSYPVWRKVYNVGFRIVIESDVPTGQLAKSAR